MKANNNASVNLPTVSITKADESFDFLRGRTFFVEKNARAKEKIKNMKLPESIISK